MRLNEQLLTSTFELCAKLGNVPICIMGDINVPPELSRAVQNAVRHGGWVDAAHEIAAARAKSPAATCFAQESSEGTRIDVMLLNNVAAQSLVDADVVAGTGLPVHLPIAGALASSALQQDTLQVIRPQALPLDWIDPEPEAEQRTAERTAADIWRKSDADWHLALGQKNVD